MSIHIAILKRPYLQAILDGAKTVESRLTKTAQPPYAAIAPGNRLFFKVSAGPFMATAIAGEIESHENLTPVQMDTLRARYQPTVGGDDAYWDFKRNSRFATFIHLTRVEPLSVGPRYTPINMKAWYVLDDRLSPLREVPITPGALRNRYAHFPSNGLGHFSARAPRTPRKIELVLPDGETITTDLPNKGRMLRWRGWARLYTEHHVQPGHLIRYLQLAPRRYAVSFHPSPKARRPGD